MAIPRTAPPGDDTWGACRFCSVAVAPNDKVCPECGAPDPIRAAEVATLPKSVRRRQKATNLLRTLVVIGIAVGLGYTLLSTLIAGPPVVDDPLDTQGLYTIGPGNYTIISGDITGGDFVIGNFSTTAPAALDVVLDVYNSTEMPQFINGLNPTPQYTLGPTTNGRIVFSAEYTDTYYFIFTNPYPASSHITYIAEITTTYESSVASDGFD